MTIGRSVVNVAQKARGKQAIKYEFEVIPFTACKSVSSLHGHRRSDVVATEARIHMRSTSVWHFNAGEIPEGHDKLLFAWERGSKLFVTDAEPVRPNRAVFWKQFLKQQATMYKTPGGFEKKVDATIEASDAVSSLEPAKSVPPQGLASV